MFGGYLERRRLRKAFSAFLTAAQIDKALDSSGDLGELTEADLDVLIVAVAGSTSEEISSRMGDVGELATEHSWLVDSMSSSVVVLTHGYGPTTKTEPRLDDLLSQITSRFGSNGKAVHIRGTGHYGNLGGPKRFSFSFILPAFTKALSKLDEIPFGSIHRMEESQNKTSELSS